MRTRFFQICKCPLIQYTFKLCFKVKAETDKSFWYCLCPCAGSNKKWRDLFNIDEVNETDKCKNNKLWSITSILQHLQEYHKKGMFDVGAVAVEDNGGGIGNVVDVGMDNFQMLVPNGLTMSCVVELD